VISWRAVPPRVAIVETPPRPSREGTVARARAWIVDGRRVDMGGLAAEVGIGRATLHRWFGTRDRLVGDAIWSIAERTLDDLELEAEGRGADRIAFVVTGLAERFLGSAPIRSFVATEPSAFNIMVSSESYVLARFAARIQRLLEVEVRLGAIPADHDPAEVATLIARVGTGITLTDFVADRPPDIATLDRAIRAFVR
jgi:AcrR family transcriptional regulator